jgi:hypothetical protein
MTDQPIPPEALEAAARAISTELTVFDRTTGELVDIRTAPTERLAGIVVSLQDQRVELAEVEGFISDELVARLDREAQWTLRVGDPTGDRQFEIKAPSPTAGTESYRPDVLEEVLQTLIMAGTVSENAASGACRRQLTLCLEVPWAADPAELADQVQQAIAIEVGGHRVQVVSTAGSVSLSAAGINKLRKVPGVGDALDRAKVTQPAGPRKAKVTVKERPS